MKKQKLAAALLALAVSFGAPVVYAAGGPKVDIPSRAKGANKVVVGKTLSVSPRWRTNDHSDLLIVSLVGVQVEESLKGNAGDFVYLEVEGGTLDGVTLHVSSVQELKPGDRAVLFLDESNGIHVAHLKGKGILKLDQQNQVASEQLGLNEIRRLVRDANK